MDSDYRTTQADPLPPATEDQVAESTLEKKNALAGIAAVLVLLILLAGLITAIYFLAKESTDTARIRDIFIIFMAVESLFLGLALIILIVQLARLTNLLQNEIKPILDSTNETVSNLKGTTAFLSNNLVAPVIKLNEYLAGFSQLLQVVGLARKPSKNKTTKGE